MATFDYAASKLMQIEMIGMMVMSVDTPNGASEIMADGELKLVQSAPIRIDSAKRTLYNANPLDDYQKSSLYEILELYHDRKGNANL